MSARIKMFRRPNRIRLVLERIQNQEIVAFEKNIENDFNGGKTILTKHDKGPQIFQKGLISYEINNKTYSQTSSDTTSTNSYLVRV